MVEIIKGQTIAVLPPDDLDIRRPPRDWVRLGKRWTEIPGYRADNDHWRRGRVRMHMAIATTPGPRKRKRRWWPWLLLMYSSPVALAVSVGVALWVLRRMV